LKEEKGNDRKEENHAVLRQEGTKGTRALNQGAVVADVPDRQLLCNLPTLHKIDKAAKCRPEQGMR
jgi:hypothetical protein